MHRDDNSDWKQQQDEEQQWLIANPMSDVEKIKQHEFKEFVQTHEYEAKHQLGTRKGT